MAVDRLGRQIDDVDRDRLRYGVAVAVRHLDHHIVDIVVSGVGRVLVVGRGDEGEHAGRGVDGELGGVGAANDRVAERAGCASVPTTLVTGFTVSKTLTVAVPPPPFEVITGRESTITFNAADAPLVLPAASVTVVVKLCVPLARLLAARLQAPLASAVAVPTAFVPSSTVTVVPASAVPLSTMFFALVTPSPAGPLSGLNLAAAVAMLAQPYRPSPPARPKGRQYFPRRRLRSW